jgi:putative membrane protein
MAVQDEHLAKQAESIEESAEQLERSATAVEQSADRNTVLAADRTVLAAERTYAAWVRTGLAALASGVGAKALLGGFLPSLSGSLIATVLILFSAFCFVAAIWRQLNPGASPPVPDLPRIPHALLVLVNGALLLVTVAVLIGIWTFKSS